MEDQDNQGTVFAYGADGLMWSKSNGEYKIYHYDYRGSVVAVTDGEGSITDEIQYNSYGSVVGRTGTDLLIIGYNGRDGVLTEPNGLLFMRARYYSPALKRFMNADIILGSIADPSTLNLYAYVNGNPISYVDPFGLSKEESSNGSWNEWLIFNPGPMDWLGWGVGLYGIGKHEYNYLRHGFDVSLTDRGFVYISGAHTKFTSNANITGRIYTPRHASNNPHVWGYVDPYVAARNSVSLTVKDKVNVGGILGYGMMATSIAMGAVEDIQEGTSIPRVITNIIVDASVSTASTLVSSAATAVATANAAVILDYVFAAAAGASSNAALGAIAGSSVPIAGTAVGAVVGFVVGLGLYVITDAAPIVNGKSPKEALKETVGGIADSAVAFVDSIIN